MKKTTKEKYEQEIREALLIAGIFCIAKAFHMIYPPLTWGFVGLVCLYISGFLPIRK